MRGHGQCRGASIQDIVWRYNSSRGGTLLYADAGCSTLSDVDEVDPEKLGQLRVGLESCVLEALGRAVTAEV